MKYVYRERLFMAPFFTIVNVIVLALLVRAAFKFFSGGHFLAFSLLSLAIVFLLFVGVNFIFLVIKVTTTELSFRFGVFRVKLFIKNLTGVTVSKFDLGRFKGYGIKNDSSGNKCFSTATPEGLEFFDKFSKRRIYISSNQPNELLTILVKYGASQT